MASAHEEIPFRQHGYDIQVELARRRFYVPRRPCRTRYWPRSLASTAIAPVQSGTLMSLQATRTLTNVALPTTRSASVRATSAARSQEIRNRSAGPRTRAGACAGSRGLCSRSFFLAAADVTAGIDLALALVEDDFGRGLALRAATDMVVDLKRPGSQSQFSTHLLGERMCRPGIRAIVQWIHEHLHERPTFAELARNAMRCFTQAISKTHIVAVSVTNSPFNFVFLQRFMTRQYRWGNVRGPQRSVGMA